MPTKQQAPTKPCPYFPQDQVLKLQHKRIVRRIVGGNGNSDSLLTNMHGHESSSGTRSDPERDRDRDRMDRIERMERIERDHQRSAPFLTSLTAGAGELQALLTGGGGMGSNRANNRSMEKLNSLL